MPASGHERWGSHKSGQLSFGERLLPSEREDSNGSQTEMAHVARWVQLQGRLASQLARTSIRLNRLSA